MCSAQYPQSYGGQCAGCKGECGSNQQCYDTNCASVCTQMETCDSCTQSKCSDPNQMAACISQNCGDVCNAAPPNASPIDAGP